MLLFFLCSLLSSTVSSTAPSSSSPFSVSTSSVLLQEQWRTGDLIFIEPPFDPKQPYDNAIKSTGVATIDWMRKNGIAVPETATQTVTHVALAWVDQDDNVSFVEAIPPAVTVTPAAAFFARYPPGVTFYHGVTEFNTTSFVGEVAVMVAKLQKGKPYATLFEPPNSGQFYCSSLVQFAYETAVKQTHLFIPIDFPLMFVPLKFWEDYYMERHEKIPTNMTGSNPTLLLHSPIVTFTKIN